MQWLIDNWSDILIGVSGMVTAASAVANLTPTDTDNRILAGIARLVDALALNWKKTGDGSSTGATAGDPPSGGAAA